MLRPSQEARRSQASAAVRQVHATIPDARSPLDYGLTDSRTQRDRLAQISPYLSGPENETFLSLIPANCINEPKHHLPKWRGRFSEIFPSALSCFPLEELRPPRSLRMAAVLEFHPGSRQLRPDAPQALLARPIVQIHPIVCDVIHIPQWPSGELP